MVLSALLGRQIEMPRTITRGRHRANKTKQYRKNVVHTEEIISMGLSAQREPNITVAKSAIGTRLMPQASSNQQIQSLRSTIE